MIPPRSPRVLRLAGAAVACALLSPPLRADTITVPVDVPTIQAAVDLAAPGDKVFVQPGVYPESVVVDVPQLQLVGRGAVVDARYAGPCFDVVAHNVRIGGFTLVNGTVGIRSFGGKLVAVENEIKASAQDGVLVFGTDPAIVRNTILAAGGDGVRILNPSMTGCPTDVCTPVPGLPLGGPYTQTTISRNAIQQCAGDGIEVRDAAALVEHNDVSGGGGYGIRAYLGWFFGPFGAVCELRNNTCSNNQLGGMYVEDFFGSHTLVERNTLNLNGGDGLRATGFHLAIEANRVRDNAGRGIQLIGQDSAVVENAVLRNGDRGIEVLGFTVDATGADGGPANVLADNSCLQNGRDGLYAAIGSFAITGNLSRDNAGDGIDLDRVPDDFTGHDEGPGGCIVTGNVVRRNNHEGIDNSGLATAIELNTCVQNKGADIAGRGDGLGTVALFEGNTFATGGPDTPQALDR